MKCNWTGEDYYMRYDMNTVIFATSNEGKMREVRAILADMPVRVLSMKEAGIKADVDENGTSFEENALIKASQIANCLPEKYKEDKVFVLADDSGLEVDYLNKEPSIYSARYMGEDTSYDIKNQAIIDRLSGVPDEKRTARFVCAIACVLPDGSSQVTRATIEGIIGYEIAGANGFGYDPIFYVPEYGCTTAELTAEQKNAVSHRGKALKEMKERLREYFG